MPKDKFQKSFKDITSDRFKYFYNKKNISLINGKPSKKIIISWSLFKIKGVKLNIKTFVSINYYFK